MTNGRADHLDLKDPKNYLRYLTGMAVESAAVLVLMAIALAISWLGSVLWR